ncbi:glycoside hydrolase family 97 N-terminal domain-containing protein [Mucilaginibacter humi]|uniref:glycoside hydrolase family 97 N-terminal domain-containing protein n=1 Tax=Mucilaginibacter humi TaxID=2732510 RepID=UPI001C2E10D0|nr:glycoside hydrolase family 97 N-terminal domain-containing protein [Mucilaginibacter humi]
MSGVFSLITNVFAQTKALSLQSGDKLNTITLSLSIDGKLSYRVTRRNNLIVEDSPLGLNCDDQDFTVGLSVVKVSAVQQRREQYQLKVANTKSVDHVFESKSITFKNTRGALMIMDLVAGKEGVAFRYRFQDGDKHLRLIKDELTGFHIPLNAKGWMEPYDKAGRYTPGYEDFYQHVTAGDAIDKPRNAAVGWCMPALFNVNNGKNWVLISETGTDGSYPGCHFKPDAKNGIYQVAFADADEKFTLPLPVKEHAYPESTLPWTMPLENY